MANISNMIPMKSISSNIRNQHDKQLLAIWVRRPGGVPDMTPEFFLYPEGQDFLACDGGGITVLGSQIKGSGDKIKNKSKPPSFMEEFFNGTHSSTTTTKSDVQVDSNVIIVKAHYPRKLKYECFVKNRILFLKGNNLNLTEELKDSIVPALELAEELKCNSLVVCLEKNNSNLYTLIRAFLYIGFELVLPGTFKNDSNKYLLVGVEI
ncbi:9621_t:CDS:2 [Diversispora eburnea]|uniref:Ornithine decarboxylase antizyme n=1 Tax=Diversispora eburnea TaxID=1213867 RepID=A0A9N9AKS3_9GLOM|nr:9621_t:CDS:2 [Diversispora eburnea]